MQENDKVEFKSSLREIKKKETKNIDQKSKKNTLYKIEMLYKARNIITEFL